MADRAVGEPGWFIQRGDQRWGPVSFDELKRVANTGELRPDDWVWDPRSQNWIPAVRLPGLFATPPSEDKPAAPQPTPAAPQLATPAGPNTQPFDKVASESRTLSRTLISRVAKVSIDAYILAAALITFIILMAVTLSQPRTLIENVALLLFGFAVFVGIVRLGKIVQIVNDFTAANGPISDFHSTIARLKEVEPTIKRLSDEVGLLYQKIDAAQKQLAEHQRYTTSHRTQVGQGGDDNGGPALAVPARGPEQLERDGNWEKLREVWYSNTSRLEAVIGSISDGRKKLKYDRMARYDYDPIIKILEADGFLSPAAARASMEVNNAFKTFRPQSRRIPDPVIHSLLILQQELRREIVVPTPPEDGA